MKKIVAQRFPDYEWYCVHCHEKLNSQLDFDDNKYSWKCTNCNYKNSISKDNLRKPYAYLKNPTASKTVLGLIQGVIRAFYGLISRTAFYFMIAFIFLISTGRTSVDHLSLGLIYPSTIEDYFRALLYISSAVFLATIIIYALTKRFTGRPDSKKHFLRETFYFKKP